MTTMAKMLVCPKCQLFTTDILHMCEKHCVVYEGRTYFIFGMTPCHSAERFAKQQNRELECEVDGDIYLVEVEKYFRASIISENKELIRVEKHE